MEYVLNLIGLPQFSLKRAFSPLGDLALHIHDHFIPHARNNYHPHVLHHRSLALMSGLLVALKIFTLTLISIGPIVPAFSSAITVDNIISLTNESRAQYGEAALTQNQILDKAAQSKADDMLAKGYFSHNTPDGHTPWDFIISAGYSYLMAGENLAVNFTEAENVETAWMNSPGHKANILNKNFEEIGIGISEGQYQDHTAIFVVQMFGLPSAQQVALNDQPTKVAPAAVPAPQTPAPVAEIKGATAPAQQSPAPEPLNIQSGEVKLDGQNVDINAEVTGPATKVVAYFGQQAIMLSPQTDGSWQGQVPVQSLAQSNATVKLTAFSMRGQTANLQLADFSSSTQSNYNLAGTSPSSNVTFFGRTFSPNGFEKNFYLFFIAGILASMILAISVKRHIQHLSLIANSSFVVIFAMLLWWAG